MPLTKLTAGLEVTAVTDLKKLLEEAKCSSFDFVAIPLVHPRFRRDSIGISDAREGMLTRSDMEVDSHTWTTCIVGKVSEWIDPCSTDDGVRVKGERALKQELAWATHLAVPAVILPTPSKQCANFARIINQVAAETSYLQLWVRIMLCDRRAEEGEADSAQGAKKEQAQDTLQLDPSAITSTNGGASSPCAAVDDENSAWDTWNTLRTLCEHNSSIGVALEITEDLPSRDVLLRWLGEPVKAIIVPTSIFLTNKKGYPVLSRAHQAFLQDLYRYKIQLLLKGKPRHAGGHAVYLQYLDHVRSRLFPMNEQDRFESPYYDYLQAPLQPLMDNLESQTYETFEKDPVKYARYEEAVAAALSDTPTDKQSVIMVVGAGRGPLVRASLKASATAKRKVRVYAVEKNPNAVITLRNLVAAEGWSNVTIVATDMRVWKAPEQADILVSELLGSFGDNELSPECLDGAQSFLKPDGISIPYEYTSYIAPISSSKLWNEVKSYNDLKHMETAYVVKLHNFCQLGMAQPCFKFEHPNWAERIDNNRYQPLSFPVHSPATVHGFAGYFEAKLYKDVHFSIVPQTFSTGMFSWFPMYIPLRQPLYVKAGDTIDVHVWRNVSPRKVWYEWGVTSPVSSPIHNPNGRSYWIGL